LNDELAKLLKIIAIRVVCFCDYLHTNTPLFSLSRLTASVSGEGGIGRKRQRDFEKIFSSQ